LFIVQPAVYNL